MAWPPAAAQPPASLGQARPAPFPASVSTQETRSGSESPHLTACFPQYGLGLQTLLPSVCRQGCQDAAGILEGRGAAPEVQRVGPATPRGLSLQSPHLRALAPALTLMLPEWGAVGEPAGTHLLLPPPQDSGPPCRSHGQQAVP